jgi:dTDP-4-amino-4,6-dideoxygalactose transaminase
VIKTRFLDLGAAYSELKAEIDEAIARVMASGWYVGGQEVEAFEEEFADHCGAKFAVGVANGLDALTLSLRAMGLKPDDEVIVPANTYIATWLAVTICGGKVVPVESDPITFNICPNAAARAVTKETKFILPVHLYGLPADLTPIYQLAEKHGLQVLEDGAQAHGARYRGRRIGSFGKTVAWSFYPGKNLGAMGDGGAVTTNEPQIADRIKLLRNYGSSVKYVNNERGFNSRLDPLQAAILRVKLKHLDDWNNRRRLVADIYSSALGEANLKLPDTPRGRSHAWHLYVILSERRDHLQQQLSAAGIETLIHYPIPPHLQKAYRDHRFVADSFPVTEQIARTCLSLPMGPHLPLTVAEEIAATICSIQQAVD